MIVLVCVQIGKHGIRSDEADEARVGRAAGSDSQDPYHFVFQKCEESGEGYLYNLKLFSLLSCCTDSVFSIFTFNFCFCLISIYATP